MNSYKPYTSVVEEYTFPSAPDAGTVDAVVYFDLEVISEPTPTLVSGTKYRITIADDLIDSAGTYKVKWTCQISGSPFYAYVEFKVEDTYVNYGDFFDYYADYDLPEFTSQFDKVEKMARRIVDTYTGQDFQFLKNKSFSYYGNGKQQIFLGKRLNTFSEVFINETDYTANVEIDIKSRYYLRLLQQYPYPDSRRDDVFPVIFPKKTRVTVRGDWGWISVPSEINQATSILMADLFDDVRREHYRYGISRYDQGNNKLYFDKNILNSTGNIDVDVLLMDFVNWNMDYVY